MTSHSSEAKRKKLSAAAVVEEQPFPRLIRVTRWWGDGGKKRRTSYLFLGNDEESLRDRPAASRFFVDLERTKSAVPSATQTKELKEAFGEEGFASISDAISLKHGDAVRVVRGATLDIRREDTMLAVRYKVAAAIEMHQQERVRIRDLYFWRRQRLNGEGQVRYVTERIMSGLYAQHSVRTLRDVITRFKLTRDGSFGAKDNKKIKKQQPNEKRNGEDEQDRLVTSEHASRLMETAASGGPIIDATTLPMGLGHFTERRGDRRLFAHDPVTSALEGDSGGDGDTGYGEVGQTRYTYDDDVRLWEYFQADAGVYAFDVMLRRDAMRIMSADALDTYYPEPTSLDDDDDAEDEEEREIRDGILSGAAAHRDLLHGCIASHQHDRVRFARLKVRSLVAGGSCTATDIISAFSAIQTDSVVPMVRIHEGESAGTDVFKLSRMAVHQQAVDSAWIGAWIRNVKRYSSAYDPRSHVMLAVRMPDEKDVDVLVSVSPDGKVDANITFHTAYFSGIGDERQIATVSEALHTVNTAVIEPLIRMQQAANVRNGVSAAFADPCTQRFLTSDVVSGDERGGSTGVTSSLAHQMKSPTAVLTAVAYQDASIRGGKGRKRPSISALAKLVNERKAEVGDYFSLAELVPLDQGGGMNLYVFGATGIPGNTASSEAARLQWSVAVRALQNNRAAFGRVEEDGDRASFEEDAARTLAPLFAVTLKEARRTVSDVLQQRHIQLVMRRPGQIMTPTLRVSEIGATAGYVLQSHVVHDTPTVRTMFRVFHALVEHAATSGTANAGVVRDEDRRGPPPPTAEAAVTDDSYEPSRPPAPRVDDMLIMDDHIKELLSLEEKETEDVQQQEQEQPQRQEQRVSKGSDGMILQSLQRADPRLFSPKSNYSKMCGKVSDRQPIHLRSEELERISPDSYTTAIRYGSTPEMAERNAYICPEVWCPASRTPMTMKQYREAGEKCPGAEEGERAMVFDKPYWKGKEKRYPGFLPSWKHPEGMCMPCCFGLPNRTCDSSTFDGFHKKGKETEREEDEDEEEGEGAGTDEKYIKRDHAVPLLDGRYGMMPKPMQHVFHRTLASDRPSSSSSPPSTTSSKKRGATEDSDVRASSHRRMVEGVCGSRPDGSGQFLKNMICYVRRGMPHSKQPFLTCIVHLMKPRVTSVRALTDLVIHHLSPLEYLGMEGGQLCRTFMDHDTVRGLSRKELFAEFYRSFTTDLAYQKATGTSSVAETMMRRGVDSQLTRTDPMVTREYMVFASLQRFKAYLADPSITKTHTMLLDLFNSGADWLGRLPLLMVLETLPPQSPAASSSSPSYWSQVSRAFTVRCGGLRRALSSKPLKDGVAFICNTGDSYEPIIRVMNKRGLRYKDSITSPSETELRRRLEQNKSAASPSVLESAVFSYDADQEVRRLVDEVRDVCRRKDKTPRPEAADAAVGVHTVATVIADVMGERLKAQVLDYGFRVVGLVTREDVMVPIPSSAKEPMLVGETAPPRFMYLADVTRLRPYRGVASAAAVKRRVTDFFGRLSSHLPNAELSVARDDGDSLVLRNGRIVPVSMTRVPENYLDNFNILIGAQTLDPRTMMRAQERERTRLKNIRAKELNAVLRSNADALREYSFLRDVMNPFPLWYKRDAMRRLLRSLPLEAAADSWDVDVLLLQGGPEADSGPVSENANESRTVIAMRNAFRDIGRGRNDRHDIIITNTDIADNAWVTDVMRVQRNPLAPQMRSERRRNKTVGRRTDDEDAEACVRRARIDLESLMTQREILKKWDADQHHPPTSSSISPVVPRMSSSDRRKRTNEGYVDIVADCHVWHVFAATAVLVSVGGLDDVSWTPRLLGRILANDLISRMSSFAQKHREADAETFLTLLREHPVLGKHMQQQQRRRKVLDSAPKDAPADLLDRLLTQIAMYPSYVPGLLDVMVFSEHFRVHCRVWTTRTATELPASTDPRRSLRPGMSPSTLRRYPVRDYGREHAPPSLHLLYVEDTHAFHVLLNGRRGLLHTY